MVHEKDGRGQTPLILAREHGYPDIEGILTDEGAEPAAGREAAEKKLPSRVILPENKGDRFTISK